MKTATEEKKYLEELSTLKASIPLINDINKINVQIDVLYKKIKELSGANNKVKPQLDDLREKADLIRAKLNLIDKKDEKKDEKKDDKKEEPENDKKKQKREATQEEKDLSDKRQTLFDQIKISKDQRNALRVKHNLDFEAFQKQQDDIYRIKFMTHIHKKLKHEENQKKWELEQVKRKEEDLEKAKQAVSFKFNEEITMCEYLVGVMQQLKMKEKMDADSLNVGGKNSPIDFKVDDKLLKEENLVFMKPKKMESEGVQPGQRKLGKKTNKKQGESNPICEEAKFVLDVATIQNLGKVGVLAPSSLLQVDKTLSDLNAKRDGFLKLRDDAIEAALNNVGVVIEELKEETQDTPKTQKTTVSGESKKKEIKFDDESFPVLA